MLLALVLASSAPAGTLSLMSCSGYRDPGLAWKPNITQNLGADNACGVGLRFQLLQTGYALKGESANWVTVSPPAIAITAAATPAKSVLVDPNEGVPGYYTADFFWPGGQQEIKPTSKCCGGRDYGSGIFRALGSVHYFGFAVTCSNPLRVGRPPYRCSASNPGEVLGVGGIVLLGQENTGPGIIAVGSNNLYYASGRWVRGVWPVSFTAWDDSGVCHSRVYLNNQVVDQTDNTPYQGSWHQCPDQNRSPTVDTSVYGQGAMALEYSATNAASVSSSPQMTIYVDNQLVSLSLNGPSDALATAGTQYVTATATAGPSGVGIWCSEDGSPYHSYAAASAQIPVQGIGSHSVSCYAQNNSINSSGQPLTSPTQTWTLSIREPTVAGISFGSQILNALRCHRTLERVKVAGRWATVRRHGRLVRVRRRAHTKTVRVMRCHPRVVRVRVRVLVHGRRRWRYERRVLLPRVIQRSTWHTRHGAPTTVHGWLGTSSGVALAGQQVNILTAADNGQNAFALAAVATTASDGSWTAKLPAGPSRLVEATYGGTSTTEPSTSGQIRVIVPAMIRLLKVFPRHVAWGGTIHIVGQLKGGYLPTPGELVRLRIGFGSAYTTYGVQEHVTGNGRFSTTYTFGAGLGSVVRQYWFQIASLPVGDYPYAPASSRRITVTVGGG